MTRCEARLFRGLVVLLAVLCAGCASDRSLPRPGREPGGVGFSRVHRPADDVALEQGPSVPPPLGADDSGHATPLRVVLGALPAAAPAGPLGDSTAFATVVDGWLYGDNPEARAALEAVGIAGVELGPGDFLPDQRLRVEDLCLAARMRGADSLWMFVLAPGGSWSLRFYRCADAASLGGFHGVERRPLWGAPRGSLGLWWEGALLASGGA